MKLIKQNHNELNPLIQCYGCRFRCLQAIAEIEEKKCLSASQIQECYDELSKDSHIMNSNCLCNIQEHHIINMAFRLLGNLKKNCRQIGIMKNEIPMGWDGKICTFDFMILHWKTQTKDGHYTLADKDEKEIFDPWDNSQNDMQKIEIQRKLLYKIRGRAWI